MSRSGYTASRLYRGTDASMRLGLRLATPAWLCVGAASILSVVGISAIGTTRPELATRPAMFLVVGLVCAAIVTIVPPRALRVLCWAVLALVVFGTGFALRERVYRWLGLAVLAGALGRVVLLDVWQLALLYRVLSFMALGIVLIVLGYVYNRWQEKIREWL